MNRIKALFANVKNALNVEDYIFLIGLVMLYAGIASRFGHAIAQIVCGVVLILTAIFVARKAQ